MIEKNELNICKLKIMENKNYFKIGSSHPYIKNIYIDNDMKVIICKIWSGNFKYIFICNCKNDPLRINIETLFNGPQGFSNISIFKNVSFSVVVKKDCFYILVPAHYKITYNTYNLCKTFNKYEHKWQKNNEDIKNELNKLLVLNDSESLEIMEKIKNQL